MAISSGHSNIRLEAVLGARQFRGNAKAGSTFRRPRPEEEFGIHSRRGVNPCLGHRSHVWNIGPRQRGADSPRTVPGSRSRRFGLGDSAETKQ